MNINGAVGQLCAHVLLGVLDLQELSFESRRPSCGKAHVHTAGIRRWPADTGLTLDPFRSSMQVPQVSPFPPSSSSPQLHIVVAYRCA